MKKTGLFIIAFVLMLSSLPAGATLITFDDLSGGVQVTNQYAGLGINFENVWELDSWNTAFAPIKYVGDHAAYTSSYNSGIFRFDNSISLFSLLVTSSNRTLYLEAYDSGDSLLRSVSQYVPQGDWNSMSIDLAGLNDVRKIILHDTGNQFGFDNITYESGAPIPEPGTMMLLGTGLVGLLGLRKKIVRG